MARFQAVAFMPLSKSGGGGGSLLISHIPVCHINSRDFAQSCCNGILIYLCLNQLAGRVSSHFMPQQTMSPF